MVSGAKEPDPSVCALNIAVHPTVELSVAMLASRFKLTLQLGNLEVWHLASVCKPQYGGSSSMQRIRVQSLAS